MVDDEGSVGERAHLCDVSSEALGGGKHGAKAAQATGIGDRRDQLWRRCRPNCRLDQRVFNAKEIAEARVEHDVPPLRLIVGGAGCPAAKADVR